MKRWQAILLNGAIAAGAAILPSVPGTHDRVLNTIVAMVAAGITANKASKTNPDGTPAERPWIKKKD